MSFRWIFNAICSTKKTLITTLCSGKFFTVLLLHVNFCFSYLQFYLNNTLALETSWISPEEMGIFQRQEKPVLRTNQTALSICRPAAASRNIHTLLLTPRRISGRWDNLWSQHPFPTSLISAPSIRRYVLSYFLLGLCVLLFFFFVTLIFLLKWM